VYRAKVFTGIIIMPREFVEPNLHIVIIHFPIALLTIGVLIECFAMLFARRSSLRVAGRWMMLFGAMFAVPTALSGVYAMRDIAERGLDASAAGMGWNELLSESRIGTDPAVWEAMTDHFYIGGGATLGALLVVCAWLSMSDLWRGRSSPVLLVLMLLSVGAMLSGAHHGGELVHVHAVTTTQMTEEPIAENAIGGKPTGEEPATAYQTLLGVAPPLQIHTILAGLSISMSAVALALGVRACGETTGRGANHASLGTDEVQQEQAGLVRTPVSRWWLTAAGVIALSSLSGIWYLAQDSDTWTIGGLLQIVRGERELSGQFLTRRIVHITGGSLLFIGSIVMVLLTRFAPRARLLLTIIGVGLALLLLVQLWVGVIMLLDSSTGPLTAFQE